MNKGIIYGRNVQLLTARPGDNMMPCSWAGTNRYCRTPGSVKPTSPLARSQICPVYSLTCRVQAANSATLFDTVGLRPYSFSDVAVCPKAPRRRTAYHRITYWLKTDTSFSLVFWEEERLVGATPSTENVWFTGLRWSEIADFEQLIARSASAVTPSEKVQFYTNRKPTTHFLMSLRWSSYVDPKSPKEGPKTQKGSFSSEIALRLKKVCYKVSLCRNCQRQSCRHSSA